MTEDAALLSCCGLRKTYGKEAGLVRAVDGVDLDVAAGETVAIMGPSGCGKSTLLHLLGGLDRPSGGEVRLAGSRVDQMSERALARLRQDSVGFVFQAFHLMDELTAVENVELPALLAGRPARAARRRATELMERVGLGDRARFLPAALSGGQRQRVAIARALAGEPQVVLADEPTGNLDSAATLEVLRLFESLHVAGQTLVIVTHDSRIAATADRMISMRDGAFIDETRLTGGTRGDLGALGREPGPAGRSPGRPGPASSPGPGGADAAGDHGGHRHLDPGPGAARGDQPAVPADPRGDQRAGRGGLHRSAAGPDPGREAGPDTGGDRLERALPALGRPGPGERPGCGGRGRGP
jgi:putative ABC transport system ATP-binding protein